MAWQKAPQSKERKTVKNRLLRQYEQQFRENLNK